MLAALLMVGFKISSIKLKTQMKRVIISAFPSFPFPIPRMEGAGLGCARTHRRAAGLQQRALDDLPVLRVEGQELLHVGKGVSPLDVEAAPGALADSEVADLGVVAHCGEGQVGENSTRAKISPSPAPC